MEKEEVILHGAIAAFGYDAQLVMAVEECSELIEALCKWKRGRCTKEDVVTEIADVMIMMNQLSIMFGSQAVKEEKKRKLERLEKRIEANNINLR